jgi:HD-GYP domain-containing protein (c-di-GMP phosphodiesterase class II)
VTTAEGRAAAAPTRTAAQGRRRSLVILAAAPATLLTLRILPGFDPVFRSTSFHLVVVSGIAACAAVVAVVAASSAAAAKDGSLVFLAGGCMTVGALLLGHGLTTPGALGQPMNMWVARLPVLAIGGFALCLAIAGGRRDAFLIRFTGAHATASLVGYGLVLAGFAAFVVAQPLRFHGAAPIATESDLRLLATVITIGLLLPTSYRHWRRWRLSIDVVQFALALAAVLAACASLALEVGELWHLAWWDYHGYLLAGFGGAAYAVLIEARRSSAAATALQGAFDGDPFTQIVRGYPEALRALVTAVEAKDSYTHGHSVRVAELAVELGVRLALDPDSLRAIARGAYLHDIGKIGVPDAILSKPGPLTADERAVIEQHPVVGCEIVFQAPSLAEALPVIRCHHERWDGTGYPDGLAGNEIPLVARVVAVADVWDALTYERAYRRAWTHAEALGHIRAGASCHFDPRCVGALEALAAQWGIAADKPPAEGPRTVADACHHRTQPVGIAGR